MEIIPRVGVAGVCFGITVEESLKMLGTADKDYVDDDGDRCLCYNELGAVLRFEKEHDSRLGWIIVVNPEATIQGKKVIGVKFSELEQFLDAKLDDVKESDDYGYWHSTTWSNSWLEVQHALGWVGQINLGVCFDETDQPLWPNKKEAE